MEQPIVVPLEPTLDFHPKSATADWRWFQTVCIEILRISGFQNVEAVGVEGDRQDGLDIRAMRTDSGEPWGFQCKQERDFGPAKVTQALEAVPPEPDYRPTQYRILLSRDASEPALQRARATQSWDIWGGSYLSNLVRVARRDLAVEFVSRFFGRYWVERFFGTDFSTTFVTPRRFFRSLIGEEVLLRQDLPLRGRDAEIDAMQIWEASASTALLLVGPMGIGRSKLLYEFSRRALNAVAMPLPNHVMGAAANNEIGAGPIILSIDDADQRDLGTLLNFVSGDPDKRLILTCTADTASKVREMLLVAHIRPNQIDVILLGVIGREATIALGRDVAPTIDADAAEYVVTTAGDTPLATIVAAKLVTAPSPAVAIEVFEQVTALYRNMIEGRVSEAIDPADAKVILRLVSAIGPLREKDVRFYEAASHFGIRAEAAPALVAKIKKAGGLAQIGDRLDVSPNVVRDAILIEACTNAAGVDQFTFDLFAEFGFSKRLFRNLAVASSAAAAIGKAGFFNVLWKRIENGAVSLDNARRRDLVSALREIAVMHPAEVIRTVRLLHRNPPLDDSQEFEHWFHISPNQVDEEIPKAIEPILNVLPRYAKACIEILWELASVDRRALNSTPSAAMRVMQEAVGYDETSSVVREQIIEAVSEMLTRDDLYEALYTPLDIITPALSLSGNRARSRGHQMELTTYSVALASMHRVRDEVLEVLEAAAFAPNDRRALVALKAMSELLGGVWTAPITGANLTRLRSEQERVINCFAKVAAEGNSLRRCVLRNELILQARRSDALGQRIDVLLDSLALDDDMRLLRALAPDLSRNWRISIHRPGSDEWDAHFNELNHDNAGVAGRVLRDNDDPAALKDFLLSTAQALLRAGVTVNLGTILADICTINVEKGLQLARAALHDPDAAVVRAGLSSILYAAHKADSEVARELERETEIDEREEVRFAAAIALQAPIIHDQQASAGIERRKASLLRLLEDPSAQVRSAASISVRQFLNAVPELAVPLIDMIQSEDSDVMESLYSSIPRDSDGRFVVSADGRERLLRRLISVERLEYFEILFIADAVRDQPRAALEVLSQRFSPDGVWHFKAVPHDPTLQPLIESIIKYGLVHQVVDIAVDAFAASALREYDAREIVSRLFVTSGDETRAALANKAAHADRNTLKVIADLAASGPPEIGADDANLFMQLVEQGFGISADVGKDTGDELMASLYGIPRFREGRQNSAVLLRIREAALDVLARIEPASESEAFFQQVLEHVNRDIEAENRDNDAAFGPA